MPFRGTVTDPGGRPPRIDGISCFKLTIQEARPGAGSIDQRTRELVRLAHDFVGEVWGHYQSRVAEFHLSLPEAKALMVLEVDRALSMRELAGQLHANPSNVTVVVSRLEARGLLTRHSTDDRRVKSVRLSDAGAGVRARLEARLAEDHPAVRGLSAAEREDLHRILSRLARSPGTPLPAPGQGPTGRDPAAAARGR